MLYKFDRIHLASSNPRETADFYTKALGAKVVGDQGRERVDLDIGGLLVRISTVAEVEEPLKIEQPPVQKEGP